MATEHFLRYLWATTLVAGKKVLDAGCGTGYGAALLAQAGADRVVGLDISSEAFAVAKAQSSKVEFVIGDVLDTPFHDGEFDVVICFEVIEHLERRPELIGELKRVLAADGLLALSSPNRAAYPDGNPHHVYEYLPPELHAELAAHFENVELYRQDAFLASAIVPTERGLGDAADETPIQASLGAYPAEGSEPFLIAMASDGRILEVAGRSLLGEPFEVHWWHDELEASRRRETELSAAVQKVRAEVTEEIARLTEAAREAGAALIELEITRAVELEQFRTASEEIQTLETQHNGAQKTIQSMQRTRIWRIGSAYWRMRDRFLHRRRA